MHKYIRKIISAEHSKGLLLFDWKHAQRVMEGLIRTHMSYIYLTDRTAT